jgi:hypothetical protein
MLSPVFFASMLLVIMLASLSTVCDASPQSLATTSSWVTCYELYQHKALATAVTACKAAQDELEPQMNASTLSLTIALV